MKNFILFLSILLVLCLSLLPALQVPYLHHDAVMFWAKAEGTFFHPYHAHNFSVGRFLGAYIHSTLGLLANKVNHLALIRFLSIATFSLSAFFCLRYLKSIFNSTLIAYLSVIIIFTLPPFEIISAYTGISFVPYAVLLAVLSGLAALKMPAKAPWPKRIINISTLFAVILNIAALSVYQSAAPFYWVMVALYILSSQKKDVPTYRSTLMNCYGVGIVSMCLYFLIVKATKPFLRQFHFSFYDPHTVSLDVREKMGWFLSEPLYNSLNLWNVFPNDSTAFLVCALLALAGIVYVTKAGIRLAVINAALFFSLMLLSFSPNLAASGEAPFYRCLTGLSSLVALLLLWAIKLLADFAFKERKQFLLTCLMLIIAVYGIQKSYTNIFYFRAKPSYEELNFIKTSIAEADLSFYQRIHLIRPDAHTIHHRYDEFGIPTSLWHLNVGPLINVAFGELDKKREWERFMPMTTSGTTPFDFGEPTLVIDMNRLYSEGGALEYLAQQKAHH